VSIGVHDACASPSSSSWSVGLPTGQPGRFVWSVEGSTSLENRSVRSPREPIPVHELATSSSSPVTMRWLMVRSVCRPVVISALCDSVYDRPPGRPTGGIRKSHLHRVACVVEQRWKRTIHQDDVGSPCTHASRIYLHDHTRECRRAGHRGGHAYATRMLDGTRPTRGPCAHSP
jgi:hypothetical protein